MVDMNIRETTARVPVAAPAEAVWAAMTDWSRQREWMLGTRVYVVAGDGRSVGSRLLGFTGLLDVGFADLLEITVWDPPRLCRVRHLGKLLRGSADFAVEPTGDGSAIRWTERLDLPMALVSPLLVVGMRASLRRLAARLSGC
jgi:carbon monoxide dehydrogenase subunit G